MDSLTGKKMGQYLVKEKLGSGGMAEVYRALHVRLGAERAIKVIRAEFSDSEDFRLRFENEARIVASLRHPNIVQVHDFGEEDGLFYMVMEFVAGRDLKQIQASRGFRKRPDEAVEILVQVANALEYAHKRGLLHRDLKPDNIMLDTEGRPILMDFGIAKIVGAELRLTQTGCGIGTPAYMAPEQAIGERDLTPSCDVYSMGIVLYEMLTGELPYRADTPIAAIMKAVNDPMPLPREKNREISGELQNVILRATGKQPQDRYQTAAAFAAALAQTVGVESHLHEPNVPQAPPLAGQRTSAEDWRTRYRWAMFLGAVLLYTFFSASPEAWRWYQHGVGILSNCALGLQVGYGSEVFAVSHTILALVGVPWLLAAVLPRSASGNGVVRNWLAGLPLAVLLLVVVCLGLGSEHATQLDSPYANCW